MNTYVSLSPQHQPPTVTILLSFVCQIRPDTHRRLHLWLQFATSSHRCTFWRTSTGKNRILSLLQNLQNVLFKRLKVQGLYVDDYDHKYLDEFYREVPPLVASGQLKYAETIVRSLEEAGQLILDVQKGDNRGKVSLRTEVLRHILTSYDAWKPPKAVIVLSE